MEEKQEEEEATQEEESYMHVIRHNFDNYEILSHNFEIKCKNFCMTF